VLNPRFLAYFADLGDIAVIGPASIVTFAMLLLYRRRHEALVWALAFLACAAVTLVLKTFVGGFEINVFDQNIQAGSFPSGHASITFVFYDGLAALLWCGSRSALPRALAAAFVLLQSMIAISVFLLAWHPLIDMVAGLLLGVVCLGAAYWRVPPKPATLGELTGLAVAVTAVVLTLHGDRLDDKKLVDRLLNWAPVESRFPAG